MSLKHAGNTAVHTYSPASGEHFPVATPALTPAVALTTKANTVIAVLEQDIVTIDLGKKQVCPGARFAVPAETNYSQAQYNARVYSFQSYIRLLVDLRIGFARSPA